MKQSNGKNGGQRARANRRQKQSSKLGRRRNQQGPPVAIRRTTRQPRPQIRFTSLNSLPIKHREYIGSISVPGNTNFNVVKSIPINPGLNSSFPWLSSTARNYESYRFNRLSLEYVPTCPTNTNGKISMMIDYDALDDAPQNSVQLQNSAGAVATQLWNSVGLNASFEQMNKAYKSRYVRTGSAPVNSDLKTYDTGIIHVAIEGNSTAGTIGDLFVVYDLTLLTPQLGLIGSSEDTQTLVTNTGTIPHPFNDAVESGSQLVDLSPQTGFDRLIFNNAGHYVVDLINRSMTAGDGGKIDGSTNLLERIPLYQSKVPGQGFTSQVLMRTNQGGWFDLQGSGTTDPNQMKDIRMLVSKINPQDFNNLKKLLVDDLNSMFLSTDYEDLT